MTEHKSNTGAQKQRTPDTELEERISEALTAFKKKPCRPHWVRLSDLVKQRSNEQVRAMEERMGLE